MKRQALLWLALLLSVLGLAGCGQTAKPPAAPPPPAIAVVDWNAVWQVHPLTEAWTQKKKDRQVAERAFNLKVDLLRKQQAFSSLSGKVLVDGQQGYLDAALQTKRAELAAKQRESLLLWEQAEQEKMERAWIQARTNIEARHQPELVNLQLKLAVLHLPAADRQRLEGIHAQALQRRDQDLAEVRRALERQFVEHRGAEQARIAAQTAVESQKLVAALQAEVQQKMLADAALDSQVAAELAKNQDDLMKHIQVLQQEEGRLAEQIENDLRSAVERLAVERKLDIVLRQVVANVKAVDLTSAVIQALQQRQANKG